MFYSMTCYLNGEMNVLTSPLNLFVCISWQILELFSKTKFVFLRTDAEFGTSFQVQVCQRLGVLKATLLCFENQFIDSDIVSLRIIQFTSALPSRKLG